MLKTEISFIDKKYLNFCQQLSEEEKELTFKKEFSKFIFEFEDHSLILFKELDTDNPLIEILPDKVDFKLTSEDKFN